MPIACSFCCIYIVFIVKIILATADKPEEQCDLEGCNRPKGEMVISAMIIAVKNMPLKMPPTEKVLSINIAILTYY